MHDASPSHRSGSSRLTLIIWILSTTLLIAGAVAFALWRRDYQEAPPRLVGAAWMAAVAEGRTRVCYVMEERRVWRGSFDTSGAYAYDMPYSVFTLHSRSGREDDQPIVAKLATIDHGKAENYSVKMKRIDAPAVLGCVDGVIWLWNGTLESRDARSLATIWTHDKLKSVNPELASLLPDEPGFCRVLSAMGGPVIKSKDARYFRIDPRGGRIEPLDEQEFAKLSPEHTKTADSAFRGLRPAGASLRGTSPAALMWSSFVEPSSGHWYGLLTRDERPPSDWEHPRYSFGPSGEVRRTLHRAPYQTEPSRFSTEARTTLNVAASARVGEMEFLMGGFLRRPAEDSIWFVLERVETASASQPVWIRNSFLVLHRKELGKNAPWLVTRLGFDGGAIWTQSTGLAELDDLCDGGGAVVLTGFADATEPIGARPNRMVVIDESTGATREINLTAEADTAKK